MTKSYGADPNAPKDPNCVACQNDWPIFVNPDTGERTHIDIIGYHPDYGCCTQCPTTDKWWEISDDDDDEEEEERP